MNGIILIDKPLGITSHDVVEEVKKYFHVKVGHTGTLDPFATGLLVLLVGDATRLSQYFMQAKKTYIATLQFGIKTDTLDITGRVIEKNSYFISRKEVESVIGSFLGEVELSIPLYSAKKVQGKKLYEYAREGLNIDIQKAKNFIYNIEVLNYDYPYLTFLVECSHGTYIRSLGEEIAKRLSSIATLHSLVRIKNGYFDIKDSTKVDYLLKKHLIKLDDLIKNQLVVYDQSLKKILNGNLLKEDKDILVIRQEDTSFKDLFKIKIENYLFIYKKENDHFKYLLKVDIGNENI